MLVFFYFVSQSISINKSTKRYIKSSSAGVRAAAGSPSQHPNTGIYHAVSTREAINTSNPPHVLRAIVRTPSANRNSPHKAGAKTELGMKKEQEKKETNGQKYIVSEVNKVTKGKVEGKHNNAGAGRSSTRTVRKHMKDIGIGTVSGMHHVAVGVA